MSTDTYYLVTKQFLCLLIFGMLFSSCVQKEIDITHQDPSISISDTAFWQAYHEAYSISNGQTENDVRSIAVDADQNGINVSLLNFFLPTHRPYWTH